MMKNTGFEKSRRALTIKTRKDKGDNGSQRVKQNLKAIITSTPFSLFMSILTIYSIFAIDIDKGFFDKDASLYFSAVHLLSMGIFTAEIIIMSYTEPEYLFHFYFWIDLFSTLTMILEVIWIEDMMNSVQNIQVAISFARVSKASRFSKIGARSTKIMKLIRLIKLIKLIRKDPKNDELEDVQEMMALADASENEMEPKIRDSFVGNYDEIELKDMDNSQIMRQMDDEDVQNVEKMEQVEIQIKNRSILKKTNKNINFQNQNQDNQGLGFFKSQKVFRPNVDLQKQLQLEQKWNELQNLEAKKDQEEAEDEKQENTKVGEILKNQIQKNIVLMVMGVIIVVPILTADTWFTKSAQSIYIVQNFITISQQYHDITQKDIWMNTFIEQAVQLSDPLDYSQIPNYNFPQDFPPSYSQNVPDYDTLRQSEKSVAPCEDYVVIFSKKQTVKVTSLINMGRSLFITFLLIFASIFFIKDLELYALNPLQKMSTTLGHIQKNPYGWNNEEDDEQEELINQNNDLELQTMILQKLIIKMANLVALGVGQAPSKFISNQLEDLQPEEDIEEIRGAYMCIRIHHHNFSQQNLTPESIKEINLLYQIIHEIIIENGGYLFEQDQNTINSCWKLDNTHDKETSLTQSAKTLTEEKKIADQSIFCLLKIFDRISNCPQLKKHADGKRDRKSRKFKIHVGLSFGTTFCGGMGSDFKLTMKCLGRQILLAKRLSEMSEKMSISNIISQQIYKRSELCKGYCRKMGELVLFEDVKKNNVQIFTVQFQIIKRRERKVKETNPFDFNSRSQNNELKTKRYMKKVLKSRAESLEILNNSKLQQLNHWKINNLPVQKFTSFDQWLETWKQGMEYFLEKQWGHAKQNFQICNDLYPNCEDPICSQILTFIAQYKEEPPKNWVFSKDISLF